MKAFNKKRKPDNRTFPRYKGWKFQVQRNIKKESVNSRRNKREIIHDRYSYKYTYK